MFATSKDGTRVPFFLTSKRGLPLDGRNPTMLYGYGGFSISVLPFYRSDVPAWLELGGVFVIGEPARRRRVRRGVAQGRAISNSKQNVFDDFIAVAEHLVKERYTSPDRLGIMGGSNGGLLVGAVMEQRPDLFAAALPAVGVMDMLRYDKFTGGKLWATEYGSSSDPRQFAFLIKYSPLHNVRAGTAIRRRSSRPPITTIASCPATPSSSPRRCRPRRPAIARCLFAWRLEARTRIGRRIG